MCETFIGQYTQLLYNFFARATEPRGAMAGCDCPSQPTEKTYPSVYQNVTDRKFLLFDIKIFKLVRVLQFGARLYHSITDNVEAMNTPIQVKHNHTEISIAVKKFRRTQKVEIDLAKQKSYLPFLSAELGHIFKSNIRIDVGVLLRGKEPHHPVFAYDIFRIHSPIINTDFIEQKFVGDTKASLLRCFPIFFRLNSGDVLTTGKYMIFQTFSNLHFTPLLKIHFIVFT